MQNKSKATVFAQVADRTNFLHDTEHNVVNFINHLTDKSNIYPHESPLINDPSVSFFLIYQVVSLYQLYNLASLHSSFSTKIYLILWCCAGLYKANDKHQNFHLLLNCNRWHLLACVEHLEGHLLRTISIRMSLSTQANTGHAPVLQAGFYSAVPVFESPLPVRPRSHVPVFDRPAGSSYRRTK
jgi:hypothetical protein